MATMDEKYTATFGNLAALVLTAKEVQQAILAKYPDTNVGSMNIADHVSSSRQAQQYAVICFERVSGGYKVLPRDKWIAKPTGTRGNSAQSDEQAKASLAAKIASLQAPSKPETAKPAVTVPVAVVVQGNKANGAATPSATPSK
jgi:hypothetical protein